MLETFKKCNPLCKTDDFEFLGTGLFVLFNTLFDTSSRAGILSNFDRILAIWGLHLETFGCTFGGHFFRSQKSQNVFLVCAPGLRLSWTPPGEGGNPLIKWMSVGTLLGWMWQRVLLCMSRNKLTKKPELFRNMLSACVFEKRFQKASGQHLLMILESFWHPF